MPETFAKLWVGLLRLPQSSSALKDQRNPFSSLSLDLSLLLSDPEFDRGVRIPRGRYGFEVTMVIRNKKIQIDKRENGKLTPLRRHIVVILVPLCRVVPAS